MPSIQILLRSTLEPKKYIVLSTLSLSIPSILELYRGSLAHATLAQRIEWNPRRPGGPGNRSKGDLSIPNTSTPDQKINLLLNQNGELPHSLVCKIRKSCVGSKTINKNLVETTYDSTSHSIPKINEYVLFTKAQNKNGRICAISPLQKCVCLPHETSVVIT